MSRFRGTALAALLAGALLHQSAPAQDPAAPTGSPARPQVAPGGDETPGLLATQVTVLVDREGSRRRFRATAVRVGAESLTVVTAAHCISEADRGWPVALLLDRNVVVEGLVGPVARNPSYRPNQPREIPGPDNAVATFRFRFGTPDAATAPAAGEPTPRPNLDPAAERAFRAIRPIGAVSTRFYPAPGGGAVAIRTIDGRGVEHAVRAGNHSNPRWLEWGPAYHPIPGDSGGGVFVVAPGADGTPRPVLIGVIVGRDDRGGGASLLCLDQPWMTRALAAASTSPTPSPERPGAQ